MRIAIFDYRIVRTNPIGGCHLRSIAGLSRDHSFTVFAAEFENPDPARVEWVRIPAPMRPLALLFLVYHLLAPIWYLAYWLRKRVKFDLIQMVESNLTFGTIAYSHFCHRAYLLNHWKRSRPTGVRGVFRLVDHALHAALEPLVYRRVRQIVVPSAGLARELSAVYPRAAHKVRVLSNPIDTEKLRMPEDFDRLQERRRLGIGATDILLVFAALGQFERKGLPVLLRAILQLNDPHVKLCVVGGEPGLVRAYQKQVSQMGLNGTVTFAGSQRDVRQFFWAADAFVLPSFYETFSLVSFEAAAAGLPLIVARLHGVEELVTEACGFVVEPTPAAVASAVARFAALDAGSRRRLGSSARRSAARYSTENFVEAWRALYATEPNMPVVANRAPSPPLVMIRKFPPVRISSLPEARVSLPALTGLRAVAAWWILGFQFGPVFLGEVPRGISAAPLFPQGSRGIDLFFLLSGFVLTYNYFRRFSATASSYPEYLTNRVARIYPLYCVALLPLVCTVVAKGVAGGTFGSDAALPSMNLLLSLGLLQSWGITGGAGARQSPGWFLSAEWFACLFVFPVAWLLLKRVKSRLVLGFLAFLLPAAYGLWDLAGFPGSGNVLGQATADGLAGCCLCRLAESSKWTGRRATILVNVSLGLLAAAVFAPGRVTFVLTPVLFGALVLGLAKSQGALAGILATRTAAYFGATSYALYTAAAVLEIALLNSDRPYSLLAAAPALRWSVTGLLFVALLLLASLLYHAVEKPSRRWLRRVMRSSLPADSAMPYSGSGREHPPLRSTPV